MHLPLLVVIAVAGRDDAGGYALDLDSLSNRVPGRARNVGDQRHLVPGLFRFARNPDAGKQTFFPRKLSETGLFADAARQTPSPGVLPMDTSSSPVEKNATRSLR